MKYKFYDHTIIAYFYFAIISFLFYFFGMLIDTFLEDIISEDFYGLGQIFMSVLFVIIYCLKFRRAFNKMFSLDLSLTREMLPGIIAVILPAVSNVFVASLVGFSKILPSVISGLIPGVCEEVIFRGPGVTNYMRKLTRDTALSEENEEMKIKKFGRKMKTLMWISSLSFGLVHILNTIVGANIYNSIVQAGYAVGLGVIFFAADICTGSIIPSIIFHSLIDITAYFSVSLTESEGIITGDFSPVIFIPFLFGMVCLFAGLKTLNKKNYGKIYRVWENKIVVPVKTEETEIEIDIQYAETKPDH